MSTGSKKLIMVTAMLLVAALAIGILLVGSVYIDTSEVIKALLRDNEVSSRIKTIIWETRMPMLIGAVCSGAMLSLAGLTMQTLFQNPLAGPSVLGISSGASFGVSLFMLSASGLSAFTIGWIQPAFSIVSALVGGMLTIAVLYLFANIVRSSVSLLIVGLMLSYLFSSLISLLNYFSPSDEIRSFLVWGLGSFNGLRFSSALCFLGIAIAVVLPTFLLIKPLNALLAGERFAESVGYNLRRLRGIMLIVTGVLVAVPTAFCGPIGFIGLIVPHICRMLFKTSNNFWLVPGCILIGAIVTLTCALLCVIQADRFGVLPINVVTPFIGVPIIIYLLVNRSRRLYF